MWGITMLTAGSMAIINLITIFAIEYSVRWKFEAMQVAIKRQGVFTGVLVLTAFSMVYALVGVCLIQFFAPSCGGSGLPENKCYLNGSRMPGFFTRRTLRIRVVTTILANAAGYPVGREGPTVVIGSNVAFLWSEAIAGPWVKEKIEMSSSDKALNREALLVDEERFAHATRIQCAVGGACGMAMIFNAPFGGVLYMFEELTSVFWPLDLTFRVFVSTMFCALLSYAMLNFAGTDIKEFVIYAFEMHRNKWEWIDVPWFVLVSVLLGVLTSFHTRWVLATGAWRQRMAKRIPRWQTHAKILETVLYCAVCTLASVAASLSSQCVAMGKSGLQYVSFNCPERSYNPVASLLINTSHSSVRLLYSGINAGEITWVPSLVAFTTYYALNVLLTGLPVPGGAFTATMLLGALFGRAVGDIVRALGFTATVSGVYAVVGSAAMLCGFKQMTLAVVLIVVECINDLALTPIVMLSVTVSMATNWCINKRGHDEEQIHSKKLPFLEGDAPTTLDDLWASDLIEPLPEECVLPAEANEETVRLALDKAPNTDVFPIVEADTAMCIGMITRLNLQDALDVRSGAAQVKRSTSRAFAKDPFNVKDRGPEFEQVNHVIDCAGKEDLLPLYRIMDPTPFMIHEDTPAPRLHGLFAKVGERHAVVVARNCKYRGIISRLGLIAAGREEEEE